MQSRAIAALNVKAGLLAGFIATVVLSILMIGKGAMGFAPQLSPIEDIVHVGELLTGIRLPMPVGWVGHFLLGTVAWGIAYTVLLPRLPGVALVKGLIFGALAWLAMMIIFMPLAGNGLFGLALGVQAVVASLVLHLIYGATLGIAYDRFDRRPA
jgi:uncharacterized membrane protein YagU involved in acid resistance